MLFLSYSKKDLELARHIRYLLQDNGYEIWMDETRLVPSERWWPTIQQNIASCNAFLVLMSPNSQGSDWVEREILVAERMRKPIFPILISGEYWSRLAYIQYLDLREGVTPQSTQRLLNALSQFDRATRSISSPPPLSSVSETQNATKSEIETLSSTELAKTLLNLGSLKSSSFGVFRSFFVALIPLFFATKNSHNPRIEVAELVRLTALKDKPEKNKLERVRDYANLLSALAELNGAETVANEIAVKVFEHLANARSLYWSIYDQFPSFKEEILDDHIDGPLLQSEKHILLVERLFVQIRNIEKIRFELSEDEQNFYRLLTETVSVIDQFKETTDYTVRARILEIQIDKLMDILPKSTWIALHRSEQRVVVQHNPWYTLSQSLVKILKLLEKDDNAYLQSIIVQIGINLDKLNNFKDLAGLPEILTPLAFSGVVHGRMIDETLRGLIEIGRDVDAALALPEGSFDRRTAFRNAHDKLNGIQSNLQTHFKDTASQWCRRIKELSVEIDEYLLRPMPISGYRNPYIVGNPIQPAQAALFKGRRDLAFRIINRIRSGTRPAFVLHGPRRMGKTSFLLQLQNLLPGEIVTVFCDMQQGGTVDSDSAFTHYLARSISRQVGHLPGGGQLSIPDKKAYQNGHFEAFYTWLGDEIIPFLRHRTLFIMFDEFEIIGRALRAGTLSISILENLRHMMQHSEQTLILFAGVQTLMALGPDASSYFIGSQTIEISYLDELAATEVICNPDDQVSKVPEYEPEVVSSILHQTHCQPFLLQAICSEIIEIANRDSLKQITLPILNEAIEKTFSKYHFYFKNVWDEAGAIGQTILRKLASHPESIGDLSNGAAAELLANKVIFRNRESNIYEFEIPLVKQWVSDYAEINM